MPQVPSDDLQTTFVQGLITETSALNSQKNAASDLQNFVLRRDGSIRRRKALDHEASAVNFTESSLASGTAFKTFRWVSAGGDPDASIVVMQIGSSLHFFDDAEDLSNNKQTQTIDLTTYKLDTATDSQVASHPVSIASGKGDLILVGRYLKALHITYDNYASWTSSTAYTVGDTIRVRIGSIAYEAVCASAGTSGTTEPTWATSQSSSLADGTAAWFVYAGAVVGANTFNAAIIDIRERDFWGINDGVDPAVQPNILTDMHEYNLRNQGWRSADITQYYTDTSASLSPAPGKQPSKNMHWYEGYRPTPPASVTDTYDFDAPKEWSTDKIDAEVYGDTLAPMGRFFRNPFDTTTTNGADLTDSTITPTSYSLATNAGFWELTMVFDSAEYAAVIAADGWQVGDVISLDGWLGIAEYYSGGEYIPFVEPWLSGVDQTIDSLTGSPSYNVVIVLPVPDTYTDVTISTVGSVSWGSNDGAGVNNPYGTVSKTRFEACAWYAGRVWYAGCIDTSMLGRIFFSRIVTEDIHLGQCFQKNDPTGRLLTALEDDDGGYINLPEIGHVYALKQLGGELYVFAEEGIWAIGGGQRGYFTASGYSIRQVSSKECLSTNVLSFGSELLAVGTTGMYLVTTEGVTTLTDNIQTLWDGISVESKEKMDLAFDENRGIIYASYSTDSTAPTKHDTVLVFDMVLKAWYKYTFTSNAAQWLLGVLSIDSADDNTKNNKIKYVCVEALGTTTITVCDMEQTGYTDWTGTEEDTYVQTGYNLGASASRRFQAPIIHVYLGKTVTEFEDDGLGGLAEVNGSSVLMTTKWDFTSKSTPGKWTEDTEVFRNTRAFQPNSAATIAADPLNDDGYPVIITRNKVRGRGRALQIKFEAGAAKDAHILGWASHLKVSRRL